MSTAKLFQTKSTTSPVACPVPMPIPADGRVNVQGNYEDGATRVVAKVYRLNAQIPATPPIDAIDGNLLGNTFTINGVPGFVGALNGTSDNNRLAVWHLDPQGWSTPDVTPVCGQATPPGVVQVLAKACIWFAFVRSNGSFAGPHGEAGDDYRPRLLSVPQDATSVAISAPSGSWRHNPSGSTASDADGRLNHERGLENQAYRNAAFNADGITPITARLNALIGMWQIDDTIPDANSPVTPFLIGKGDAGPFSVPSGATRLFLAFHDGHEWSNNSGTMDVSVTWS